MKTKLTELLRGASAPPPPDGPDAEVWGLGRRVAFRFAFVYVVLYFSFGPFAAFAEVPPFGHLFKAYEALWHAFVPWVVKQVAGPSVVAVASENGSGDTTYGYAECFCQLALAAAAAAAWSAFAGRRPNHARLDESLRVYVRYSLAASMLVYGMAKVFKLQFSAALTLDHLSRTYGESSPMGLLWTFMGYSTPYKVFTGGAEVLGGALLLFRRTTTLGAMVVVGVMANVVMLNFCYDVPVKLYSSHLLAVALFLLAADARRLIDVLVLGRATGAVPARRPSRLRWVERVRLPLKALLIAAALYQSVAPALAMRNPRGPNPATAELVGTYQVEAFERVGDGPPAADWSTVVLGRASLIVRRADGVGRALRVKVDSQKRRIGLTPIGGGHQAPGEGPVDLAYERPDPEHLRLEGEFEGERVVAALKRVPDPPSLLMSRGFRWVNEFPYNR